MRSRWFHRPFLHGPTLGIEKKASWLELFFDLTFVAAFIQLGNGLSAHITPTGLLAFAGTFVSLWVAWTGFTFFQNRYTVDDFVHRTVVLLQMLAVAGMALTAAQVLDGATVGFSIASGAAQLAVAAMYLRASVQVDEARDYGRYWGGVFLFGAVAWFAAALLPSNVAPWLWAAATLGVLSAVLSRHSMALAQRFPTDFHHLSERYALLTLIVLGESFVKVITALVDEGAGFGLFLQGAVALILTCGIWWVYFDDIADSHIREGRGGWIVWLYAHLPLQMAIVASAVAIKKAVHFEGHEAAPDAYRWLLSGSLASIYFSVAAIDSVTERHAALGNRARVNARWLSAILLLVLAPAGSTMSGATFLMLVLAINVAQVVFDMAMAPEQLHAHAELGTKTTAELARERGSSPVGKKPPRADVRNAVRKGVPASARRDLYFYLMEGSWPRVFVAFGFVFLAANVFFAALYVLEPGAITNARPQSFADAFFFSVQTMSTVGYGSLSPGNDYANAIVTVEAGTTIIGMAIVTGLVFAKASRPKSTVLVQLGDGTHPAQRQAGFDVPRRQRPRQRNRRCQHDTGRDAG